MTGSRSLNWRPPGEQPDVTPEKNGANGANGAEHTPAPASAARDDGADKTADKAADKTDTTDARLVEEPKPAVAENESDEIPFDEEAAKPKRRFLSFGRGR